MISLAELEAMAASMFGEANGFSKLTATEVEEIRLCLETLPATKAAIARAYSVHPSTIWKIASSVSWT